MDYVDYEYYSGVYGGKIIQQDAFSALALRAQFFVDMVTFGRVKEKASIPDCVKMSVCACADVLCNYDKALENFNESAFIKSETVDGYRVDYESIDSVKDSLIDNMCTALQTYLPKGHPLRYRGKGDAD